MNSKLNFGPATKRARIFGAIIPLICAGFLSSGNNAIAQNTPAPDGNLNGATISISLPLRGMVRISNGKIVYTGTGSPALLSTGSQITGVSISGGTDDIQIAGNNISITKCNPIPSINANECNNLTIRGNTIVGNNFDGITMNGPGQNDVITGNHIICDGIKCKEGMHILNGGSVTGFVCSYNEVRGYSRWGMEFQTQFQSAQCEYNWIHAPHLNVGDKNEFVANPAAGTDGGQDVGAISWACGYTPYPPVATSIVSNNCIIAHNVIDQSDGTLPVPLTVNWSQNCGIELYGNNATVANNWEKNCGNNEYYQTTGFKSQNNVWIGLGAPQTWVGEGIPPTTPPTPSVAPAITGDQSFALNANNIPAAPVAGPAAQTSGSSGTGQPTPPATQPGATGAAPAAPQALNLTNNANGTLSGTVGGASPISSLTIAPTTANPTYPPVTFKFPSPSASFEIGNIPANWLITLSADGSGAGTSVQVTGGLAPAPTGWAPVLLQPVAQTTPTPLPPAITEVITTTVFSNGSATVTTQP